MPESQGSNLWVIVGVVVPVLVVMVIVVILYWKLCRTDKLEFQPDTVASIQQRQKVRPAGRRSRGRARGTEAVWAALMAGEPPELGGVCPQASPSAVVDAFQERGAAGRL